jgi:hypothetical protein
MSSLAELPNVVGVFSYSRDDDRDSKGRISELMDAIKRELGARLGRSERNFSVFHDQTAIRSGRKWEEEIKNAIRQTVFFVTIVTPRSVSSPHCSFELRLFLTRQGEIGRDDLVFPILFIPVSGLKDANKRREDPILSAIAEHQFPDWTKLRYQPVDSPFASETIGGFCDHIVEALSALWSPPANLTPDIETAGPRSFRDEDTETQRRLNVEQFSWQADADTQRLSKGGDRRGVETPAAVKVYSRWTLSRLSPKAMVATLLTMLLLVGGIVALAFYFPSLTRTAALRLTAPLTSGQRAVMLTSRSLRDAPDGAPLSMTVQAGSKVQILGTSPPWVLIQTTQGGQVMTGYVNQAAVGADP